MARLSGKVAFITGAARGIGRAIALRYAQEGASLILSDLNLAGVQETAQAVEEAGSTHGVRTAVFQGDVTDRADIERTVQEGAAQLGRLDILVNNAGIFGNAAFESMTDDEWQRMVDINLTSVFKVSQIVIRHWLAAGTPGAIINLASISSFIAFTESSHYCATKAAVAALTRCVAMEFGPYGIRANAMAPGIIATEMTRHSLAEPSLSGDWQTRIPLRRYGTPEDVADLALFLASDDAGYLSGETITLDGAGTMTWTKPSDATRTVKTDW